MRSCTPVSLSAGCQKVDRIVDGTRIAGTYCYCAANYCNNDIPPSGTTTSTGSTSLLMAMMLATAAGLFGSTSL
jgi:hypothetical protein